jgi:hypothetical protein
VVAGDRFYDFTAKAERIEQVRGWLVGAPGRLEARGDCDGELGVPLWGHGLLFWVPVARSTIRLGDLF